MTWLTGWTYRKSHVINYAAGAGTLYQKQVTVHYGSGTDGDDDVYLNSHCRTDFQDVRFTDDDGSTLLDYWMEKKVDSDYAIFWIEVADDLSSSNATIYVYFGKADATTTSNGTNTFPSLFDHFDGSAEPPEGWSELQIGTLTWSDITENSSYKVYNFQDSSAQWHGNEIYKTGISPPPTFALRCKVNVVCKDSDKPQHQSSMIMRAGSADKVKVGYEDGSTSQKGYYLSWITGTDNSEPSNTRYIDQDCTFEIRRDGTNIKTFWNEVLRQTKAETAILDEVRFHYVGGASSSSSNPQSAIDWVYIRKFVDPEPAHGSWGSEETSGAILKEVTDSLSLSDAVLRDKTLAISDSVGLADAPLKHWTPQISDSIALSDSILRNKAFQILDSLGLSDTILRGEQFSVSDSISLCELVTVITEIIKQVTDSLSLSDIVSLNKALVLADQIQLTDNVYVNKILIISDYMALVEVVEKSVQGVVKTKIFLIMGDLAIQLTGD